MTGHYYEYYSCYTSPSWFLNNCHILAVLYVVNKIMCNRIWIPNESYKIIFYSLGNLYTAFMGINSIIEIRVCTWMPKWWFWLHLLRLMLNHWDEKGKLTNKA